MRAEAARPADQQVAGTGTGQGRERRTHRRDHAGLGGRIEAGGGGLHQQQGAAVAVDPGAVDARGFAARLPGLHQFEREQVRVVRQQQVEGLAAESAEVGQALGQDLGQALDVEAGGRHPGAVAVAQRQQAGERLDLVQAAVGDPLDAVDAGQRHAQAVAERGRVARGRRSHRQHQQAGTGTAAQLRRPAGGRRPARAPA